jgi:hypothetical protein
MKILATCAIAGIALVPLAAFGQSADADAKYCRQLYDLYRQTNQGQNTNAAVPEAANQCNKGNYAAGIPVLEKALKDARVTLPARN